MKEKKIRNMRRDAHAGLFHLPLHSSCHLLLVGIIFFFLLCHGLFSACLPPSLSPVSSPLSFPHSSLLCLGKRLSRNKAINKKSSAFSVPAHYRLLMYAFCSSITHQPQINALIFRPARLISVAVTTAQRGTEQISTL